MEYQDSPAFRPQPGIGLTTSRRERGGTGRRGDRRRAPEPDGRFRATDRRRWEPGQAQGQGQRRQGQETRARRRGPGPVVPGTPPAASPPPGPEPNARAARPFTCRAASRVSAKRHPSPPTIGPGCSARAAPVPENTTPRCPWCRHRTVSSPILGAPERGRPGRAEPEERTEGRIAPNPRPPDRGRTAQEATMRRGTRTRYAGRARPGRSPDRLPRLGLGARGGRSRTNRRARCPLPRQGKRTPCCPSLPAAYSVADEGTIARSPRRPAIRRSYHPISGVTETPWTTTEAATTTRVSPASWAASGAGSPFAIAKLR